MSWITRFSDLTNMQPAQAAQLAENSQVMSVPEGTVVFGPGMTPDNLLLLLSGSVRVQQLSEKGREIVLYRVRAGESCILTTACVLSGEAYSAQGIAESDVEAVAIPSSLFDQLVVSSSEFRQFIFAAYSRRITELFQVVEDIAFQRIDVRLAERLVSLAAGEKSIRITHQQLAIELGTAREVISRQLSEFHRRKWIEQSRGVVELLEPTMLQKLAGT